MYNHEKIPLPIVKRLPRYYRCLIQLRAHGITGVSSAQLADSLGTTASQVRQDFNSLGHVGGRQGVGYNVDGLLSVLEHELFGDGALIPAIQIGAGRLGKAVSRFISRETNGYNLMAVFDEEPALVGHTIGDTDVEILNIQNLAAFCKVHQPLVAVMCVPRESAKELTAKLVALGIQGFWNFSHYDMSVDYPQVIVENVHLGDSLMSLGYRMRENTKQTKKVLLKVVDTHEINWNERTACTCITPLSEGHACHAIYAGSGL